MSARDSAEASRGSPMHVDDLTDGTNGQPGAGGRGRAAASAGAIPSAKIAQLLSPKYYSPIDVQVRKSLRQLYQQVEALKKKLSRETSRRAEAERGKYALEQENLEVKLRFLGKLERVEKELMKYREEFTLIEKRNDWLESMRETFEGEADAARMTAVDAMARWRTRQLMATVVISWRFTALRLKVQRIRAEHLADRIRRREMLDALAAWGVHSAMVRDKKAMQRRADKFFSYHWRKKCVAAWGKFVTMEKRKRFLLQKIMIQKGQFLARIVFTVWREYASAEKIMYLEESNDRLTAQADDMRARALQRLRLGIMQRTCLQRLRGWKSFVQSKKRRREVESVLGRRTGLKHLRRGFAAWREYTVTSRRADQKTDIARQSWERRLMGTVLFAWKSWATGIAVRRQNDFDTVLLETHVTMRTNVARLTMAMHEANKRSWFMRWRVYVQRVQKFRSMLRRSLHTFRVMQMRRALSGWMSYWRMKQHMKFLRARADVHSLKRLKLNTFRQWQHYIFERRRTRLLSQKVHLDLQTKSLVRTFDSMGMNVEDRKRQQDEEVQQLQMKHEEEFRASEELNHDLQELDTEFDSLRTWHGRERDEWDGLFTNVTSEFENALDIERCARQQVEETKQRIVMEMQEVRAAKHADRFALRRSIEEKLKGILSMLEDLTRLQSDTERKYTRELEILRRRQKEGCPASVQTEHAKLNVHNIVRKLTSQGEASYQRMLKEHEWETRIANEKRRSILQSMGEIEEMKDSLVRDHREFEQWIRQDSHRHNDVAISDTASMISESEVGGPMRATMLEEATSKEKMEQLMRETREVLQTEMSQRDREGQMEMTEEDYAETEAHQERVREEEEEPALMDSFSPDDAPPDTDAPPRRRRKHDSGTGPGFAARPRDEDDVSHARPMATDVAFFVRPDKMPTFDEGDNRKLELEVLRLRRKFERQEKQIRRQFGEDMEMWRRRYEHVLKVLMEVEDWKQQMEEKQTLTEARHSEEIRDLREIWERKLDHETRVREDYQRHLAETETKLHALEDLHEREVQKLSGLVRYYESSFGVLTVNVVTEMGRKRQREAQREPSIISSGAGMLSPGHKPTTPRRGKRS